MFSVTSEHWEEILPKIEKICNNYNKKFSKFDGELKDISAYSGNNENEIEFFVPTLRFYPFDSRNVCRIECDDDNKATYSVSLPNHIYNDEEFDNIVNGLEKVTSCKLFYENLIDEITELV